MKSEMEFEDKLEILAIIGRNWNSGRPGPSYSVVTGHFYSLEEEI